MKLKRKFVTTVEYIHDSCGTIIKTITTSEEFEE